MIAYPVSFILLDVFGSYKLYNDRNGITHWVWRGAFMWYAPHDTLNGREQFPTPLGVVYFPIDVLQVVIFDDYHVTLTAFAPVADGIYFDYPEMGRTWENHGHTINKKSHFVGYVEIPGANRREALRNYKELK